MSLSDEVNGKKVTRAYSLASAPHKNRFDLCLNRVNLGTFSPHLFNLEPGGSIPMKGPFGSFSLRQTVSDSIFVATGTGIAPFRSMMRDGELWEGGKRHILILGVRFEDGVLYSKEFERMAEQHPSFEFWPVVSRPTESWTGRSGHVQPHVLEAIRDRRDVDVYLCGLKDMVNEVRKTLRELGFEKKRIIFEKYD